MANMSVVDAEESDFSWRKIRIATVCLLGTTFASSMLPFSALGLIMIPMTTEFGWSRAQFSLCTTFLMWSGATVVTLMGRTADRVGVRPVIILSTAAVGLMTLAMSLQTAALWQFYLSYALLGSFGASILTYQKVLASLFTQHRGKALAIFGVESTVVSAAIPAVTNALMLHFGWRGLYVVYGLVILAIVPLLYFMLEEPGRPRGALLPGKGEPAQTAGFVHEGMTVSQALRDRVFWLLVISAVFTVAPSAGMMTHTIAAIIGKGFTQTAAANVSSVTMLVSIFGTLIGGYFVDRIQTAKVNVPFSLGSALGWFIFLIVTSEFGGYPLLFVGSLLFMISSAALRPMGTYFHTRFFGLRAFSEIYGLQFAVLSIAMGFSPPLIGLIYDRTHSYDLAIEILIACSLIGGSIFLTLGPYRYAAMPGSAPMEAVALPEDGPIPVPIPAE